VMAASEAPSQGRIFISYRRQETAYPAGWLYDRLAERYAGQVFKDVDSIELGDDFVDVITAAVAKCDVLLALIGDEWVTIADEHGRRRLDDPDDFVRLEIEAALTRNVRVIPILVDGATMPRADELPPSLVRLVRRQALELSPARFDYDTSRLLKVLDRTFAEVRTAPGITPKPSPPVPPAGLTGSSAQGRVELWWDPPVAGSVDVVAWQVRRDGTRVGDVTEPRASDQPPGPGSYTYTVTAVGVDGQHSAKSEPSTVVVPSAPVAPAGLSGSSAQGWVELRWDPPVAGSVDVVAWQVRRDGTRVGDVTEPRASDRPPGPRSYAYTVTAVGVDGQHSAESSAWVRPGRRPRWLIPAVAILTAVLATAGLFLWAPWQPAVPPAGGTGTVPPAGPPPVAPAGLTGDVSGTKIALRWEGAPSGSAAVAQWRVLRDGEVLIDKVTVPQATVRNEGFHSYTVVAVGKDGQHSAESKSWHSPAAWQKLKDTGFKESFSAAGVAEHNGELWVVGGQDDGKRDEVRVFNPQTKKWKDGPKLPEGISHAPLVSTGDKLYLLGGLTAIRDDKGGQIGGGDRRLGRCRPSPIGWCGVPLATVYSLDTGNPGGTWIKKVELPAARFSGAAAWDGQRLVFAGGAEQFEPNTPRPAAADIWELRSGKWESIDAVLQPAREHLTAVSDGEGTIWFVGGADHIPRKVYADVDVLRGNKASDSTAIRTAVQGAAAIWTPDTGICVFGGSTALPDQTKMPVAEVECLDGTDLGWPNLPEARYNAGAVVIDHTVYVVGGYSDSALKPADMVFALRFG
jgi:TIR domain/Kelch motif